MYFWSIPSLGCLHRITGVTGVTNVTGCYRHLQVCQGVQVVTGVTGIIGVTGIARPRVGVVPSPRNLPRFGDLPSPRLQPARKARNGQVTTPMAVQPSSVSPPLPRIGRL